MGCLLGLGRCSDSLRGGVDTGALRHIRAGGGRLVRSGPECEGCDDEGACDEKRNRERSARGRGILDMRAANSGGELRSWRRLHWNEPKRGLFSSVMSRDLKYCHLTPPVLDASIVALTALHRNHCEPE